MVIYILLKKESVNNLYKFNIVVENNKKDNLYALIMKSKLYGLQSLLCEKCNMELDDYDDFLYLYISKSKGLDITYEDFYDTYSRDEINEMYIDCIVQQYINEVRK